MSEINELRKQIEVVRLSTDDDFLVKDSFKEMIKLIEGFLDYMDKQINKIKESEKKAGNALKKGMKQTDKLLKMDKKQDKKLDKMKGGKC